MAGSTGEVQIIRFWLALARRSAKSSLPSGPALLEQFHRRADARRAQIAVVIGGLGCGHRSP
jgi:hypothetical protein